MQLTIRRRSTTTTTAEPTNERLKQSKWNLQQFLLLLLLLLLANALIPRRCKCCCCCCGNSNDSERKEMWRIKKRLFLYYGCDYIGAAIKSRGWLEIIITIIIIIILLLYRRCHKIRFRWNADPSDLLMQDQRAIITWAQCQRHWHNFLLHQQRISRQQQQRQKQKRRLLWDGF